MKIEVWKQLQLHGLKKLLFPHFFGHPQILNGCSLMHCAWTESYCSPQISSRAGPVEHYGGDEIFTEEKKLLAYMLNKKYLNIFTLFCLIYFCSVNKVLLMHQWFCYPFSERRKNKNESCTPHNSLMGHPLKWTYPHTWKSTFIGILK